MVLRTLFSRNKKHSSSSSVPTDSLSPSFSLSSTANDHPNPSSFYANLEASSSKLGLSFTRKRSPSQETPLTSPPPRPSVTGFQSDTGSNPTRKTARSHPPPSKSAYFAVYAEQAAVLSTQSLPNEEPSPNFSSFSFPVSEPITLQPSFVTTTSITTTPPAKSRGSGFFPWAKSLTRARAKGKAKENVPLANRSTHPLISPLITNTPSSSDSFNLRSFRHIRAPSPTSAASLPIAAAHPRSGSNASEVSQRISVAAFREVHARRSTAESSTDPEPSPRVPGRAQPGTSANPHTSLARSTPNLRGRGNFPRQPPRRATAPIDSTKHANAERPVFVDSTDAETEDESESEEDNDEDNTPVAATRHHAVKGNGRESITVKFKAKAKSEMGHSSSSSNYTAMTRGAPVYPARAVSAYELEQGNVMPQQPPRSQSSLGVYGIGGGSNGGRPRASASASALVTSDGTPRSSYVDAQSTSSHRVPAQSSQATSSEEDSSDEDAPLSSLVNARSSGTSTSLGSSMPRKPLIDISTLKLPTLPPSKGVTSVDANERPARFLSPVNSLISSRAVKGDDLGLDKKRTKRAEEAKNGSKDTNSTAALSGNNLSNRLALILQQDNSGAGKTKTDSGTGSSVNVVKRAHHRRASSDGYVKKELSGVGWVMVDHTNEDIEKGPNQVAEEGRIVPTPIRQRDPPSSFSVTSRPQHPGSGARGTSTLGSPLSSPVSPGSPQSRQRSTTLITLPTASSSQSVGPGSEIQPRQRSSSLLPYPPAPVKPFSRRKWESPGSSTGDSSSGRAPLTPRDGSDLGKSGPPTDASREFQRENAIGGHSAGKGKGKGRGHAKKPNVNFEDSATERERRNIERENHDGEVRRRERRRGEAKAAIELGNVINGPGPVLDDEEEEATRAISGGRMSMMNPAMTPNLAMGGPMSMGMPMSFGGPRLSTAWGPNSWSQQQQQQAMQMQMPMVSPSQFMIPPPADPNLFAAHQQAMMFAKQAYQMAVAQQALLAAGEEWERGSNVSGFGGGVGSVYGGGGMGLGAGWGAQQGFPFGQRASFANINSSQSDYGGGRTVGENGDGRWNSSRSVFGESFGPSGERERARLQKALHPGRESGYFAGGGPEANPNNNINNNNNAATGEKSRVRTTSGVARPRKPVTPPSSWRAGSGLM